MTAPAELQLNHAPTPRHLPDLDFQTSASAATLPQRQSLHPLPNPRHNLPTAPMISVLTPPSTLASYSSTASSEEYSDILHHPARTYGGDLSVPAPAGGRLQHWLENSNKSFGRATSHVQAYHTPPLASTDGVRSQMVPRYHGGLVTSQGQMASQLAHDLHNSRPASRAQPPVPQPQVAYQPTAPEQVVELLAQDDGQQGTDPSTQIVSYLQIPSSINSSKGSLSEFAAQITCLFWFESSLTLQRVEDCDLTPLPTTPLVNEAKPSLGFRKWVTTMLSTTQVTQNVILLALMFIHRLKKQNPQVRGKAGSEYRLLTVALMLGNKFLDDNTYTNKTWADVSGISVVEIHVMEVEFLSNMRYTLYTSEEDWAIWHKKLGRFWVYFERSSKVAAMRPLPAAASPASLYDLSPKGQALTSSPTSAPLQISPPRHSNAPAFSHPFSGSYLPPAVPEPAFRLQELSQKSDSGIRKRSYDETVDEPHTKRRRGEYDTPPRVVHNPSLSRAPSTTISPDYQAPRLPMPANFGGQMQAMTRLPPPSSNRAMSMVYGQSSQPLPLSLNPYVTPNGLPYPPPTKAMPHPMPSHGTRVSIPSIFDHSQPGTGTPLQLPSSTGSPSTLALTPTSQEYLSPSGHVFQRSSPYRPVRSVNTLLVSPPASSLQAPLQGLGTSDMHYQSLGRPPSERRTGVVPFMKLSVPWYGGSHTPQQYANQ